MIEMDLPSQSARKPLPQRPLAAAVAAIVIALALVGLSKLGLLPDGPDAWTADWRTALLSSRAPAQRTDISVVLVNDESLARYASRSPIDRALLADLVRAIDSVGPKAIALDFIFDRAGDPQKTAALVAALKSAKAPVVIGAVDERSRSRLVTDRNFAFQKRFLAEAGRPAAHIYFAHKDGRLSLGDEAIRAMVQPSPSAELQQGLAEMLADIDGKKRRPSSPLISWLLPPRDASSTTFPQIEVMEHDPGPPPRQPNELIPRAELATLKDRIVLIGGEFDDRDRHLTPLSVADGQRSPGVLIHAQILAQLRDGRSVDQLSSIAEAAWLFLVAFAGFVASRKWRLQRYGTVVYAGGVATLGILGAIFFALFSLILPSTTLLLAWLAGVSGGHYCDWFLRLLGRSA